NSCDQIRVFRRNIAGGVNICRVAAAAAGPCRATNLAPALANLGNFNTHCAAAYANILAVGGRAAAEGGDANEKKRRHCEGTTSLLPVHANVLHLGGTAICKFQEAKTPTPAQCRAKPQSDWTKDPCSGLLPDACKKADKVCTPESTTLMPLELTQPARP
ncbi:MAG: hypothetical protein AAF320_05850, partial [Myxococcota bacterium]